MTPGIFNASIFNNQVFNTGVQSVTDTHDGAGHYKKYRKRLESAAKAAEEYNRSKYINAAVKAAAVARDIEVPSPVLEHIADSIVASVPMPSLDFRAIQAEISQIIQKIDQLEATINDEEEMIILMGIL